MTSTPCVSIIIPIFNASEYLARTLASVQRQTLADWELIAVDDGSHDESAAIVCAYAAEDPRIHLIQQPNGGVANARNRGYRATHPHSPYLIFLDHDDTWEPHALETLVDALENDTTACAAHGRARYISANDQPHSAEFIARHVGILDDIVQSRRTVVGNRVEAQADALRTSFATFAVSNCILSPSTTLLRRALLPSVPTGLLFDVAFAPCDDWHLWVRMVRKADFLFVPHVLCNYRLHSNNASRNQAAMDTAWHTVMRDLVISPENTPTQRHTARVALAAAQVYRVKLRLAWAWENLGRGHFLQAAKQFRHAFRYHLWGKQQTNF